MARQQELDKIPQVTVGMTSLTKQTASIRALEHFFKPGSGQCNYNRRSSYTADSPARIGRSAVCVQRIVLLDSGSSYVTTNLPSCRLNRER